MKTLALLSDIPEGGAITRDFETGDGEVQSLILARSGGHVSAFCNVCPHAGTRLDWAPGKFLIEDGFLICPAHGAMFELRSGACVSGPCRGASLVKMTIEISDGEVKSALP